MTANQPAELTCYTINFDYRKRYQVYIIDKMKYKVIWGFVIFKGIMSEECRPGT